MEHLFHDVRRRNYTRKTSLHAGDRARLDVERADRMRLFLLTRAPTTREARDRYAVTEAALIARAGERARERQRITAAHVDRHRVRGRRHVAISPVVDRDAIRPARRAA